MEKICTRNTKYGKIINSRHLFFFDDDDDGDGDDDDGDGDTFSIFFFSAFRAHLSLKYERNTCTQTLVIRAQADPKLKFKVDKRNRSGSDFKLTLDSHAHQRKQLIVYRSLFTILWR